MTSFASVLSLLLAISLAGCGIVNNAIEDLTRNPGNNNNQRPQTTPVGDAPTVTSASDTQGATKAVLGSDDRIQVVVPVDWQEDQDLNTKADLQVSNRDQDLYLIVLSEKKADFRNMSMAKHSALTREILVKKLSSPQERNPTQLTIGGNPAMQYEIQGSIYNLNVVYLHTTVETPTNYHQILAWTPKSQFDQNAPKLQAVIQSFRELETQ